jgi:predicted nucleic acid-binding protein
MECAFWDSSSLIPICIDQLSTPEARALELKYRMAVWWCAPVEIRGSFARLVRVGKLTSNGQVQALVVLDRLRREWAEIEPSGELRIRSEEIIDRFSLKAADAFQLAAAWVWCLGRPRNRPFIAGDKQLLEAARQLGFNGIES